MVISQIAFGYTPALFPFGYAPGLFPFSIVRRNHGGYANCAASDACCTESGRFAALAFHLRSSLSYRGYINCAAARCGKLTVFLATSIYLTSDFFCYHHLLSVTNA